MKKLLLYLLAILTSFICIGGTNAATAIPEISSEISIPTALGFYNCSSSTSCTTELSTNVIWNDSTATSLYTTNASIGTAGVRVLVNTGQALQQDYMYSYNFIMCFGANQRPNVDVYVGYNWNTTTPRYYRYTSTTVNKNIVNISQVNVSSCYLYSVLLEPNISGDQWLNLRIYNSSLVSSNSIFFVGHSLESVGLANDVVKNTIDSSINSAISNSGLASAASVQEVNKAISNMNTEIANKQQETNNKLDQTNEALGDINDSLTNSDAPDGMDSLGSASGWLPPGPVDSLLTLPLSMLNNISTSLGSTCKPINLPIPFVDNNLTMPCLNTIYSQITGLGVFLNSIGTIAAGFMLYYYFKKLYAYIDNLLSLKNNGEGWGDV